jgi:hypothetical protein
VVRSITRFDVKSFYGYVPETFTATEENGAEAALWPQRSSGIVRPLRV